MRLINVDNLSLKEFNEANTPEYAILSHTWVDGQEVSFHEMQSPNRSRATKHKSGFKKIERCANEAKDHNLAWIWVDTCCIDKSSSAELSEAINSMYHYYRQASVCFAYLADVDLDSDRLRPRLVSLSSGLQLSANAGRQLIEKIRDSKWFTRGWTLQELIAPKNLFFYSSSWRFLGEKRIVARELAEITRIPPHVLKNGDVASCSIAQRISWAATRQTTRTEDIAYCLLGILEINMPLLYGEGGKAFIRLQEEIIRNSTDQSILAWEFEDNLDDPLSYLTGCLADSPKRFKNCGSIVEKINHEDDARNLAFAVTNLGLNINLPINIHPNGVISAALNCQRTGSDGKHEQVRIFMRQLRRGLHARIPTRKDLLVDKESLQQADITIIRRTSPFAPKVAHFSEAYALMLTSKDNQMKKVFMAPGFDQRKNLGVATSKGLYSLRRPPPPPKKDTILAFIVAGDYRTVGLIIGITPGTERDVLWCQFMDMQMIGDVTSQTSHVRNVVDQPLSPLIELPRNNRVTWEAGTRFKMPTDNEPRTFSGRPGSLTSDASKLTIQCSPEVVDDRLVLHIDVGCLW
ncbi:uncharacterized protein PV09_03766 [Verruconis gallopava]|uniref:Uncharacterized protein n=1 Tax=Verruconis gallopava TaxID=253628 RepID=A0A0D2AE17_9PEZI|nr:uncharacterized protein PV09_03766 [Verruconis gallopava]KIW05228.1 hypothetical protein PV09_03766 [Verruconis gallopava]